MQINKIKHFTQFCLYLPPSLLAHSSYAFYIFVCRLTAKQKKSRQIEGNLSKKMLGLDKYEAEKAKEGWYTKYLRNGIFSTKNAVIGISAVIFAAAGTAAYSQFYL